MIWLFNRSGVACNYTIVKTQSKSNLIHSYTIDKGPGCRVITFMYKPTNNAILIVDRVHSCITTNGCCAVNSCVHFMIVFDKLRQHSDMNTTATVNNRIALMWFDICRRDHTQNSNITSILTVWKCHRWKKNGNRRLRRKATRIQNQKFRPVEKFSSDYQVECSATPTSRTHWLTISLIRWNCNRTECNLCVICCASLP